MVLFIYLFILDKRREEKRMQKNVSATYSAPGCNISAVYWPTNPPIYIFVGKQMEGH